MFKEKDNMRPGPTPERVLAICRLVAKEKYTSQELIQLSALQKDADLTEEYKRRSIDAAEELNLIKKNGDKYILNVSEDDLSSAEKFRRVVAKVAFDNSKSTFFKLTEWFVANSDKTKSVNRFDDFAAIAAKTGVDTVTENDVLGWRFWMRYLGHAYQYNKTLIPNMKTRLEDALLETTPGTKMTCVQFVLWIKENIPEAAKSCSNASLPLAVSNGLRTLQHEGKIEMISTRDAIRTSLYKINGVELNDFSEIIIKEIG